MAAFEIPNLRFSGIAKDAIEQYTFVAVNKDETYSTAKASAKPVAVAMNEAKAGEVLEMADGIVMVKASEKIAAGDAVKSSEGKAAKDSEGTATVGIALTNAESDEYVTIKFI